MCIRDSPRVGTLIERIDETDRRGEIRHIQAPHQVARHSSVNEVNNHATALLADIYSGVGAGKINNYAAFTVVAAAEIDVAQTLFSLARRCFGKFGDLSGGLGGICRRSLDSHDQGFPLKRRSEIEATGQI